MHRTLREHLPTATGSSDVVVAIFLDVRGFSSFARIAESSEAATFLRTMYLEILDKYFSDATFFKPTGDGLMIIRHVERDSLEYVVTDSIDRSKSLVENFPQLCDQDPMINFEVPSELGIGITRGAVTRLVSGDYTLDYSGRPLNLAARLMDLARPAGVVFDATLIKGVDVPEPIMSGFSIEDVYVKGIAELSPVRVYCAKDVKIRSVNRRPLIGKLFEETLEGVTVREAREFGKFIHRPSMEPIDPDAVILEVHVPDKDARGNKHPTLIRRGEFEPVRVSRGASGWELGFDYGVVTKMFDDLQAKDPWKITRKLKYAIAEMASDASVEAMDTATQSGGAVEVAE